MSFRTVVAILEVLGLTGILLFASTPVLRVIVGLPILAHLGWGVLTSVPLGGIPGPPPGVGERRRNHRLRYRVAEFLREVKRVEAFARQAQIGEVPAATAQKSLQSSEARLRDIVSEIMRVAGQTGV